MPYDTRTWTNVSLLLNTISMYSAFGPHDQQWRSNRACATAMAFAMTSGEVGSSPRSICSEAVRNAVTYSGVFLTVVKDADGRQGC
jgi:hypothetical protein